MSDNSETDYEVGQDNVQIMGLDVHNPVFAVSGLTIIAFVFFSLVFREQAAEFFGWLRPALTSNFDWVTRIPGIESISRASSFQRATVDSVIRLSSSSEATLAGSAARSSETLNIPTASSSSLIFRPIEGASSTSLSSSK